MLIGLILSPFFVVFLLTHYLLLRSLTVFFLTFLLQIFKAYGIDPVKPSLQQDCCLRTGALISFRSVSCVLHHKTERSTLLLPFSNIILVFKTEKRFKDNHEIAVLFFIFIGDKKDEKYLPEGHAVKEPFRK